MRTTLSLLTVTAIALLTVAGASSAWGQEQAKYEIKIEQVKAQPVMSTRFRARPEELGGKFTEAFGALFTHITSNGGEAVGPLFGRYFGMDGEQFDVEAGVPVKKVLPAQGAVGPSELPGGTVVTTLHVGPYERLGEAHATLQQWIEKNGKKTAGPPWESYMVEPSTESDPNKYETKLFQPIEAAGTAQTR